MTLATETFLRLDYADGPHRTDKLPGTGDEICQCGNHRTRCQFGRMHVWGTAYFQGRLLRTSDTFYCYQCGAVCLCEEQEHADELALVAWGSDGGR